MKFGIPNFNLFKISNHPQATFALACTPISFFSDIVALVPATTTGIFSLIWPPLFYWKLQTMKHGTFGSAVRTAGAKFHFCLHMLIVVIAVVAIVMGIWGAIDSLISHLNPSESGGGSGNDADLIAPPLNRSAGPGVLISMSKSGLAGF